MGERPKNAFESALSILIPSAPAMAASKSSAEAFVGSALSCAGGISYFCPGRTVRTFDIPMPIRFIASTTMPCSFMRIILEYLPIISAQSTKVTVSPKSFCASMPMFTILSRFGCSTYTMRPPARRFLSSIQKAGASIGFSFLTFVSCILQCSGDALMSSLRFSPPQRRLTASSSFSGCCILSILPPTMRLHSATDAARLSPSIAIVK